MAGLSLSLSRMRARKRSSGGTSGATTLVRNPDGTVTILSLGPVWSPNTTREANGTVTVGA